MQKLNLPEFDIRIRNVNGQKQVFDIIRNKYVALIPEEWVRQYFINFLLVEKKIPRGLISVEHPLTLNSVNHRADIVAFSRNGIPLLVVECKSPDIQINQSVIQQVSRYNLLLKAPYLILTNGLIHFCIKIDFSSNTTITLDYIPTYDDMIENKLLQ